MKETSFDFFAPKYPPCDLTSKSLLKTGNETVTRRETHWDPVVGVGRLGAVEGQLYSTLIVLEIQKRFEII